MIALPVRSRGGSFGVVALSHCKRRPLTTGCHEFLLATTDFGRTWSDITPPGINQDQFFTSVFFLDSRTGWVIGENCDSGRPILFRTMDGGKTWSHGGTMPYVSCNAGSGLTPFFIDNQRGWMVDNEATAGGASILMTPDGGATWSKPTPTGAPAAYISFANTQDGWLGRDFGSAPWRTTDGGRRWHTTHIPLPSDSKRWHAYPGVPTFFAKQAGVLPVSLWQGKTRAAVAFDVTKDDGRTWHLAATARLTQVSWPRGGPLPEYAVDVSAPAPSHWWIATGDPATVFVSTDTGRTWHRHATRLPQAGELAAATGKKAWLTVGSNNRRLFRTRDGGKTWHRVRPSTHKPGVA